MQSATFAINLMGASITYGIPGFAVLSALFDQIMIEKVEVKFTMTSDPSIVPQPGGAYPVQCSSICIMLLIIMMQQCQLL